MEAVLLLALLCANPWTLPDRAVVLAAQDAEQLDAEQLKYSLWLWCPDSTEKTHWLSSLTLNHCVSERTNPAIFRPRVLLAGELERLDLRDWAPRDPQRLRRLLDAIADPYLYEESPGTGEQREALSGAELTLGETKLGPIPAGTRLTILGRENSVWLKTTHAGRNGYVLEKFTKPIATTTTTRVVFSPALGDEAAIAGTVLQRLTGAARPLLRVDELMRVAHLSNDDGKYYDFIDLNPDYAQYLTDNGVDTNVTSDKLAVRSFAMAVSGVTNTSRSGEFHPTIGVGIDVDGVHCETHDNGRSDNNVEQDALRNLLDTHRFKAMEVFTTGPNGRLFMSAQAVQFQGDKRIVKRAAEVPIDVATNQFDWPHDRRIVAPRDCIICHYVGQDDGWKPVRNLAKQLVDGAFAGRDRREREELLARYRWDDERLLRRLRDSQARFVAECTGRKVTPAEWGTLLREWWLDYVERDVTPSKACRELGIDFVAPKAIAQKPVAKPVGKIVADNGGERAAAAALAKRLQPSDLVGRYGYREDPLILALTLPEGSLTRAKFGTIYLELFRRTREPLSRKE